MPFYSDPGYYYSGGGYQLYSPYYTSNPYSTYSGYSRALGGTYIVPSSRVNLSSSRYKPKLSTISESPIGTRNSGLIPLTRIRSPKVSYHTSPHFTPPRPIPISTADIDVSATKYKNREKSQESEESKTKSGEESDCNNNNVEGNSPFISRIDGNDSVPHHSTIKRDRPIIRLSIMRQRSKDSQKRGSQKDDKRQSSVKKRKTKESGNTERQENLSWRDIFKDDLAPKQRESPRKSPGELMKERYLFRDKKKEEEIETEVEEVEAEMPIDIETIFSRRLSLPKPPSFHDICQDISSDKIDDDLNAGELRRRASIIQEQEAEIINQLQKSGSGTFHLILERCESEDDDCRKSIKRKSKKGKKVRHKITATVHVDNPPLTPIIQESPEDGEVKSPPVEPKLKLNVEKIEEDHTIHKIFKLPKKKPKAEKIADKVEKTKESGSKRLSKSREKGKESKSTSKNQVQTEVKEMKSSSVVQSPTPLETKTLIKTPSPKQSPTPVQIPTPLQTPTPIQTPTPAETTTPIHTPTSIQKSTAVQSPTKIQSLDALNSPKSLKSLKTNQKSSKPEYFTFDIDCTKNEMPTKVQTPKTPITPKTIATLQENTETQLTAKPKPIVKMQRSDSGDDFWAQIGSRETLYMNNRKKLLLEQQWAKRESLFEDQEVMDSTETAKINDIKQKIGSQKAEALKKAVESIPEGGALRHSESNESVLKEVLEKELTKEKVEKAKKEEISSQKVEKDPKSNISETKKQDLIAGKAKNGVESKIPEIWNKADIPAEKTVTEKLQQSKESLINGKDKPTTVSPAAAKTPEVTSPSKPPESLVTTNAANTKVLQAEPKINAGLKAKLPEINSEQNNSNTKGNQIPSAEENVRAVKKVSPQNKTKKPKSQNRKESSKQTTKKESETPPKKDDVTSSASEESGRKGEHIEEKAKQQSNVDHQQGDKIRTKETGSRKEDKKLIGLENQLKGLRSDQQQKTIALGDRASLIQDDVKSGAQNQIQSPPITPLPTTPTITEENQKLHEADKKEKIVGGDINDANKTGETAKDEVDRIEANGCKLSKFPTVSDLNRCLRDVDAELSDYNPSEEEDSSYDSSEDEGDSMKKKNRDKKKDEKFNPNKAIKLDHKKKCYVKEEAPPYPLIATPRPLWKREKFNYPSQSDSESEETESDSECSTTDESSDELNPNKDNIIRMSTCSSDSGFEGGTAPSSPKKMLGKSFFCCRLRNFQKAEIIA